MASMEWLKAIMETTRRTPGYSSSHKWLEIVDKLAHFMDPQAIIMMIIKLMKTLSGTYSLAAIFSLMGFRELIILETCSYLSLFL